MPDFLSFDGACRDNFGKLVDKFQQKQRLAIISTCLRQTFSCSTLEDSSAFFKMLDQLRATRKVWPNRTNGAKPRMLAQGPGKQNSRPTAEEAARRLIILRYLVVRALSAPPREMVDGWFEHWSADDVQDFTQYAEKENEKFWRALHDMGLWDFVSPDEQHFGSKTIVTVEPQEQFDASWRIESAQILLWALGLIQELPPYDEMADHDLLEIIPSENVGGFIHSARLRSRAEIDRARDIAELWHWRSRTRQLIEDGEILPDDEKLKALGFHSYDDIVRFAARKAAEEGTISACIEEDFPALGKAYRHLNQSEWMKVGCINIERHLTLNWLCGYAPGNRWDETPTDT